MIKVINISSKTVEIANTLIRPHTGHIFDTISLKDRQRLSAMSAVGIVRAYEGDYSVKSEPKVDEAINSTVEEEKPVKKQNKKK